MILYPESSKAIPNDAAAEPIGLDRDGIKLVSSEHLPVRRRGKDSPDISRAIQLDSIAGS